MTRCCRRLSEGGKDCLCYPACGCGTFQPVRVDNILEHKMHSEWLQVSEDVATGTRDQAAGGRVIAAGTTSVRSLETAAQRGDCAL